MAVRGWGGPIVTAVGAAAGVGAAQLGLGYGLGIIAWRPDTSGAGDSAWVGSLAWATWVAATSTVAGAIYAHRLSAPSPRPGAGDDPGSLSAGSLSAGLWRLALAAAAAVGALTTVVLIAVPARAAERADTFSPQTIAAGYAVVGVIVGLILAGGALASRAIAANILATMGWMWLLSVLAVIDGVAAGRGLGAVTLGVWRFTAEGDRFWFRNLYLPGAALSLVAALLIGALAAWPAARRLDNRIGVAVSGAVGPLLVAAAYFLAAPRLEVRAEQLSTYLIAPYAVIAGLAGSVLVAALGERARDRRPRTGGPRSDEPIAPQRRTPEGAETPVYDQEPDAPLPGERNGTSLPSPRTSGETEVQG